MSLFSKRDSLSIVKKCLMFGDRSDISFKYRKRSLNQLDKGYSGQNKMKD